MMKLYLLIVVIVSFLALALGKPGCSSCGDSGPDQSYVNEQTPPETGYASYNAPADQRYDVGEQFSYEGGAGRPAPYASASQGSPYISEGGDFSSANIQYGANYPGQ